MRAAWTADLQVGQVHNPVKGIATNIDAELHLCQVHAGCGSRLQYKKLCSKCGEIPGDQVGSAYEVSKGQLLELSDDDLAAGDAEKTIVVESFVSRLGTEPLYYSGKHYYLLPDGQLAGEPYAILRAGLRGRLGLARATLHGKEQLVAVYAMGADDNGRGLLALSGLRYAAHVRGPAPFALLAPPIASARSEDVRLMRGLVDRLTLDEAQLDEHGHPEPIAAFADEATARLLETIQAKIAGRDAPKRKSREKSAPLPLSEALARSLRDRGPAHKKAAKTPS